MELVPSRRQILIFNTINDFSCRLSVELLFLFGKYYFASNEIILPSLKISFFPQLSPVNSFFIAILKYVLRCTHLQCLNIDEKELDDMVVIYSVTI